MNRSPRGVRISRRALLAATALAPGAAIARAKPRQLGLILKMKDDLARDWIGTLEKIAAIGYRELEFPGHLGPSAAECRRVLDRLKLAAIAGGDVYKRLDAQLDDVLADAHVLGKRYICCYWPWLDGGTNKSPDDWRRLGDTMNALGTRIARAGMRLAYHNHDLEFRPFPGASPDAPLPYDLLVRATDPSLVTMQLDLWWVAKANASAAAVLDRHRGRFSIVHIKEPGNTPDGGMKCDGATFADLGATLTAAANARVQHFVCENEDPADHYRCARATYELLRRTTF
jgi:sugar phosphate isomerase/epimerase